MVTNLVLTQRPEEIKSHHIMLLFFPLNFLFRDGIASIMHALQLQENIFLKKLEDIILIV